jgi:hypothetical protein
MGIAGSRALAKRLAELPQPTRKISLAGGGDGVDLETARPSLSETLAALAAWTGLTVGEDATPLARAA